MFTGADIPETIAKTPTLYRKHSDAFKRSAAVIINSFEEYDGKQQNILTQQLELHVQPGRVILLFIWADLPSLILNSQFSIPPSTFHLPRPVTRSVRHLNRSSRKCTRSARCGWWAPPASTRSRAFPRWRTSASSGWTGRQIRPCSSFASGVFCLWQQLWDRRSSKPWARPELASCGLCDWRKAITRPRLSWRILSRERETEASSWGAGCRRRRCCSIPLFMASCRTAAGIPSWKQFKAAFPSWPVLCMQSKPWTRGNPLQQRRNPDLFAAACVEDSAHRRVSIIQV